METISFPHFSPDRSTVHAALYTNVTNGAALRKRIIDAAVIEGEDGERERDAVNFAFIDARLITSRLHLQTAIYQAILAEAQGALRTRTVHSEVIWALNPTNNITEALRRYGVSEKTTAVIVVRIDGPEEGVEEKIAAAVAGTLTPFTELDTVTDWAAVKKASAAFNDARRATYATPPQYNKLNNDPDASKARIDNIVVSMVAMKSVMS
ncbi:hypothetical protein DXG03_005299 [Asterophora parasitica]|uniref:EKC/KEOPS complex subunit CGI121 n=1 Tax=Asterophora parasitica TaxID=117018 RepID=A0A9P7GEY0_9AGAR|nr:hypothetical protein DXG03_005299 [Asterophora parasitica]